MAEATKNATKATEPAKEKVVKIRIPRLRDNQDDVFVGVNGRTWLIKRGVEVEVPECVAEVIRNSEEAAEASYAYGDSAKK
jgi:hypothetical protein